jgi:hypothetical protein
MPTEFPGCLQFRVGLHTGDFPHHGSYSIVIKDNHYDAGDYCEPVPGNAVSSVVCVDAPKGPYYMTQLDPNMHV